MILNGTAPKARNGTGVIALNGHGNGNGNGNRHGASPRNGTGAIALNGNGNGATAHGPEDDHGAGVNGNRNGRPHDTGHTSRRPTSRGAQPVA